MSLFRTVLGVSVDAALSRKGLRQYKYVSPPLSVCERLFLNDFWDRVAQQYPLWLAPNLVTLMGGFFVLLGTSLLFQYSPRLEGSAPSWVYCVAALCLFGYQTCDGSDGKQARRTGAGSPLGHLFDHGLDSLVGTIVATWAVDFFGQGTSNLLFPLYISLGQLAFFLSNLVCVHKGSQVFYPMDVQEVLLAIMAAFLLKGLAGTEMLNWQSGPKGYRFPLWEWGTGLALLALLSNCCRYVWNTLTPHFMGAAPCGRRIETAFGHLLAITVHSVLVFLNLRQAADIWHPGYAAAAVSFSGLTLSLLLVVVTGVPFPALHWALITQAALFLARDEPNVAWGITVAATLCLTHYAVQVGIVIKQELGIHMFRIKTRTTSPPPPAPEGDEFDTAASQFSGQELSHHHVRIDVEEEEIGVAHEDGPAP